MHLTGKPSIGQSWPRRLRSVVLRRREVDASTKTTLEIEPERQSKAK